MKVGNTVIPLRALHYIRANYSKETFLATLGAFLYTFWHGGPYANLSEEEALRRCLAEATDKHVDGSGKKLFTATDVQKILDGRAAMKQSLSDETAKALELGAFGAPWFWAVNGKGEGQPFFGSDRFVLYTLFTGKTGANVCPDSTTCTFTSTSRSRTLLFKPLLSCR